MLLRKLIVFAITSGLAKKAYDHYRSTRASSRPITTRPPGSPQAQRAGASPATPAANPTRAWNE